MATDPSKAIWIMWESQRRTEELSAALNIPLCKYLSDRSYPVRLALLSVKTSFKLFSARPETVIVQNPSVVLATIACLLQPLLRYNLVVDRHSNFKFETMASRSPRHRIFHILSRYTVRKAGLTIVTNEFLREIVEKWGGRGFVLPDKIPLLNLADKIDMTGKRNIVFVCSHSEDEPLEEVIEAARLIDPHTAIHVTGDSRKAERTLVESSPQNVVFTGFLDEKKYQSALYSCDAVMVLTTDDHLLPCGAYEAVSFAKPLILSDQGALREFFRKGAVFAGNESKDIAAAIQKTLVECAELEEESRELAVELERSWQAKFDELQHLLGSS